VNNEYLFDTDQQYMSCDPRPSSKRTVEHFFLEFLAVECHEIDGYIHERLKRANTIIINYIADFHHIRNFSSKIPSFSIEGYRR